MKKLLALIAIFLLPSNVFAQNQDKPKGSSYAKLGLVFSKGSIADIPYKVTGISVDMEVNFAKKHLYLSGWSVGYRKDDRRFEEFGHLLNGTIYRNINFGDVALRPSFGMEWGLPGPNFDNTKRVDENNYTHMTLVRNVNFPGVSHRHDGVLYPFVEGSILFKKSAFLFEVGSRVSFMDFHVDTYKVLPNDVLIVNLTDRKVPVIYVFAKIGLKMSR